MTKADGRGMPKCFTGQQYGGWTVILVWRKDSWGKFLYLCKCECGSIREVYERTLKDCTSWSCGCRRTAALTKHGYAPDGKPKREYRIYHAMKGRCNNPKRNGYERYGGAGIKVCQRWMDSFENFVEDMGRCPDGHSIHRVDGTRGYEPKNCIWASQKDQARNKKSNINITFNGQTMCLADWGKLLGVRQNTLMYRITNWGADKALSTPVRHLPYKPRKKTSDEATKFGEA